MSVDYTLLLRRSVDENLDRLRQELLDTIDQAITVQDHLRSLILKTQRLTSQINELADA